MRVRSLIGLLALVLGGSCGGDDDGDGDGEGQYEARCGALCEISGSASEYCDEQNRDACVDACVVHTEGLAVDCVGCLLDNSDGLRAEGFECRGPELAPITSSDCTEFCQDP